MFANPHKGEVSLLVGGASFVFRPSFEAVARIEDESKTPLVVMAALTAEFRLPIADLIIVLRACSIRPLPVDCCLDDGLLAAQTKAFRLIRSALTGDREIEPSDDEPEETDGNFPIRRALEIATGVLGWTPDEFWRATPVEYMAALAGLNLKNGGEDPEQKSKFAKFKAAVAAAEAE